MNISAINRKEFNSTEYKTFSDFLNYLKEQTNKQTEDKGGGRAVPRESSLCWTTLRSAEK